MKFNFLKLSQNLEELFVCELFNLCVQSLQQAFELRKTDGTTHVVGHKTPFLTHQEMSIIDLSNRSWMTTRGRFNDVSLKGEKQAMLVQRL